MIDNISFHLIGKVLEQDIVSESDVLLLKKGTILTYSQIELLQKHHFKRVKVSENKEFDGLYLEHINHIQELFTNLEKLKKISIQEWFKKDQKIVSYIQTDRSLIEKAYSIDVASNIFRHSANVGLIAFFLGKLLRYSYRNKLQLWQMGVLHDIGKMQLDSTFLESGKTFTKKQQDTYKKYPEYGWNILKQIPDINVKILNAVRNHQERIDGSGFPRGLTVKYLHVTVQIISVADMIDELMSKKKNNLFDIIYKLNDETLNNKLSPAVVMPFIHHTLRKYTGHQVLLNDDRLAEIAFVSQHEPAQPLLYFRETDTFLDMRKFHKLKIVNFA